MYAQVSSSSFPKPIQSRVLCISAPIHQPPLPLWPPLPSLTVSLTGLLGMLLTHQVLLRALACSLSSTRNALPPRHTQGLNSFRPYLQLLPSEWGLPEHNLKFNLLLTAVLWSLPCLIYLYSIHCLLKYYIVSLCCLSSVFQENLNPKKAASFVLFPRNPQWLKHYLTYCRRSLPARTLPT